MMNVSEFLNSNTAFIQLWKWLRSPRVSLVLGCYFLFVALVAHSGIIPLPSIQALNPLNSLPDTIAPASPAEAIALTSASGVVGVWFILGAFLEKLDQLKVK